MCCCLNYSSVISIFSYWWGHISESLSDYRYDSKGFSKNGRLKMKTNLGKNNKICGNKNAVLSLSLILMLSLTLIMAFAPISSAQFNVRQPEKTAGYASIAPKLVGVDQTITVNLWVFPLPTRYDMHTAFNGFYGVTVTFVRPDGSKDSFMPVDGTGAYIPGEMSSLGSMYFFYKPQMAGNWSVSFTMPAQHLTDKTGTVLLEACTSIQHTYGTD
jgi:hypothetical protein